MEAVSAELPRATTAFTAMTWYNSVELLVLIFFIFRKYSGLYFWSLIVDVLSTVTYATGRFIFMHLMSYY